MCNPRRVRVQLNQPVNEAWRTTVEQAATATGEVRELARLTFGIPLAAEMGDLPLRMFERVLRGEFEGFDAWEQDADGNYRRDLGEVMLIYRPTERQMSVEAGLTEQISEEARASAEACGFSVGEVAVEAVGHYYDDNWGGRTRADAQRDAEREAERRLRAAVQQFHHTSHREEIEAAEREAQARAEQQAAAQLDERRAAVRQLLRTRLQDTLTAARDQVTRTVHRLVGEAYRQSLILIVRQNGGRVLADERSGSVINLELELF